MVKVLLNQTGEFLFQGTWYGGKVVKVEPNQVSIAITINGKPVVIGCFAPTEENTKIPQNDEAIGTKPEPIVEPTPGPAIGTKPEPDLRSPVKVPKYTEPEKKGKKKK